MNSVDLHNGATALSYPADQVRKFDRDRYLTAIFAPPAAREDLFALYAFNLEIAKVSEVVTEPLIGRMRLQWWRDTLDRLYAGESVAHEVARPLGEAIARHGLERAHFDRLIDARELDVEGHAPADMKAFRDYAEGASAPLLALALQATGGHAAEAARAIGTAWALTGLLRAVPFQARRHRLYLPSDLLAAHKVRVQGLFDLKPSPGLPDAVRTIGGEARNLLAKAKPAMRSVPKTARSPALIATLAEIYLKALEGAGWNPFRLAVQPPPTMLAARLGLRAFLRGY